MNRLSRYLFLLSLVFLISLGLFIGSIYLREAQKFQLNNASSLRLLTFTGFVVTTAFLFGSALVALKKPFWGQKVLFVFERFIKQEWVHKSIFLLSVSTFVFITIPLWNIFIWGDARYQSILFRFSPIVFLLGSLSLIVIRTKYLKADRNKCVKLFLISSFCFGAGILLQSILMKKLELPLPISLRYQFVYVVTCLIFSITFIRQEKYDSFLLLILVALVVVLFVVEWFMFPNKLRRMLPGILLSAPIIILSLPLISLVLMNFWKWLRLNSRDWMKKVVYGLLTSSLIILAITYYQAARIYSHEVNIDSTVTDQSAYLRFIKEARRLDFNYTGDHNRMPLYPYLQALFYHPDMNEQELFEQAKQFNLILSMILLVCLFLALLWLFGFFRSYLLILIIAFSLYIFKAPYVQAEILYYSLSALGFILMLVMLYRPTWLGAIATGIILGFAYLTKGTMLSSLPLFLLLYGIDLLIFALKKYESRFNEHLLFIARRAAYLLVVPVMFAVIIFPYAQALKQRFGHYFYNVNTTFYIWYDDWDVAKKEEAKHQFAKQWPAHLAADELPSLRKYVRDHTFRQILDRFRHGIGEIYEIIFFRPFSVTNYWISYLFILLMGILINLDNFRKFTSIYTIPLMFAILYFAGYLIAFSWYCPIACGRRFTFSLYIPFLIAVFMAIKELANIQSRKSVESQLNLTKFFTASNVIVGITLIYNIWLVTSEVIFFDFYDS